jgi:large subunit ribosomal protein L15
MLNKNMQIHQVKSKTRLKSKKRVGRGGKRGLTSGRGTKGQKARAGHRIRPEIRDAIKKLPKRRGFKFSGTNKEKPVTVNLSDINDKFKESETVSPKTLSQKNLISIKRGKIPSVKILGGGNIKKKLVFQDCIMSSSVVEKITDIGGIIKQNK